MATSLLIKITNTGAPKYKVYYRKKGTNDPWAGGQEINATPGAYTETSIIGIDAYTYEVYVVTICADGSESENSAIFYSRPCKPPLGLNVYRQSGNFIVQYSLPTTVGRFRLKISYPNGGSSQTDYVADQTNQLTIPIPPNNYGDYTFTIASICNIDTEWISDFMSEVLVEVSDPSICGAPSIQDVSQISLTSQERTMRFVLGGYTSTVKVYINNTTTNTNSTLTQAVTSGHVDIPLPRGSVVYNYQVTVYNICGVGQDNLGDTESIEVAAN